MKSRTMFNSKKLTVGLLIIYLAVLTWIIVFKWINSALREQMDNCPKKGHKKIPPNFKKRSRRVFKV